jgi:hypothetical protein
MAKLLSFQPRERIDSTDALVLTRIVIEWQQLHADVPLMLAVDTWRRLYLSAETGTGDEAATWRATRGALMARIENLIAFRRQEVIVALLSSDPDAWLNEPPATRLELLSPNLEGHPVPVEGLLDLLEWARPTSIDILGSVGNVEQPSRALEILEEEGWPLEQFSGRALDAFARMLAHEGSLPSWRGRFLKTSAGNRNRHR